MGKRWEEKHREVKEDKETVLCYISQKQALDVVLDMEVYLGGDLRKQSEIRMVRLGKEEKQKKRALTC